jgi:formylglycine-generating enzyme required for sulfatase activity
MPHSPALAKTLQTLQKLRIFHDRLSDGGYGPEMVWLPGGSFTLGQAQNEVDEHPLQQVVVEKFAIGRYPITFAEYDAFVDSVSLRALRTDWWPSRLPALGQTRRHIDLPSDNGWGRGRRPLIQVSWFDAVAYAVWLSEQSGQQYRLATEAEWEYAARAGTQSACYFGDHNPELLAAHAWYADNAGGCTHPVGTRQPNPWGLYDMYGNVWEWTCSQYLPRYGSAARQCLGTAAYQDNPPPVCVRGGAWINQAVWLRSGLRYWYQPAYKSAYLGFRLVRV